LNTHTRTEALKAFNMFPDCKKCRVLHLHTLKLSLTYINLNAMCLYELQYGLHLRATVTNSWTLVFDIPIPNRFTKCALFESSEPFLLTCKIFIYGMYKQKYGRAGGYDPDTWYMRNYHNFRHHICVYLCVTQQACFARNEAVKQHSCLREDGPF